MTTTSRADSSNVDSSLALQNVPVLMDSKGRVRVSREQRRTILEQFEKSGVSVAQFAKLTGLKYSTLAGWRQRYRRRPRKAPTRRVRLLEAVVEHGAAAVGASASVVLRLAGGAQMELSDSKQIPLAAALIRSLAQPC